MSRPRITLPGPALRLILMAACLPLFFLDLGPWRRVFAPELHTFGHLAAFALVAWAFWDLPALARRPFPVRALAVLVASLLLGGLIELVQPYFGRSAALRDIIQNGLGAAAVIAWKAPRGYLRRWLIGGLAVILVLQMHRPVTSLWDRGVAQIQFPVLSDFSTTFEHHRWSNGEPSERHTRWGGRSLRVDLPPGRFVGTSLRRSLGDWGDYKYLTISVYNPDRPLMITVSIRDHAHFQRGGAYRDRFNRRFVLKGGWNTLTIPVRDVRTAPAEREQNLADLAELAVFTTNLEQTRTLYLDRVQLHNQPPGGG
ncbi:MAG: hypothetical protein R6V11_06060 [Ectothiorhodospiraceae bacterium]